MCSPTKTDYLSRHQINVAARYSTQQINPVGINRPRGGNNGDCNRHGGFAMVCMRGPVRTSASGGMGRRLPNKTELPCESYGKEARYQMSYLILHAPSASLTHTTRYDPEVFDTASSPRWLALCHVPTSIAVSPRISREEDCKE